MWTSLLANKFVRWVLIVVLIFLFIFGIFKAGEYVQQKVNDTITKVTNDITKNIQVELQKSLDEKMGKMQGSLETELTKINGKFDEQQKNINDTKSKLDGINDVWLRVERVRADGEHVSDTKGTGSQSTGSGSGGDGTYYAKLPTENVQFLKGEAYRADQCAVRLGAAQQTLVQYKGAFEKYQDLVQTYLSAAQVGKQTK